MGDKTAFVVMSFDSDSWNDKRYQAICEVLREAGFEPTRADEIKTSGPSAEEVCEYLESAPLVVIDTTGDSHNVSYELGYCHGIKRSPEKTVLLRRADRDTPFSYRHYRHRTYRDLRHLKRLLREWFSISTPLTDDQLGYVLNFEILPGTTFYGGPAADAIIAALKQQAFSGRCEYYAADASAWGMPSSYLVGLGLKLAEGSQISSSEWMAELKDRVQELTDNSEDGALRLSTTEWAEMRGIRACLMLRGTVEFEDGDPVTILDPGDVSSDSWFIASISSTMQFKKAEHS